MPAEDATARISVRLSFGTVDELEKLAVENKPTADAHQQADQNLGMQRDTFRLVRRLIVQIGR